MKWNIYCVGHEYTGEIENILHLFFENSICVFHRMEGIDLQSLQKPALAIAMENGEQVIFHFQMVPMEGPTLSLSYGEKEQGEDLVSIRKHRKRVMGKGLIKLLEQCTGMVQPWGILTGIRPTKLMHTLVQEGKSLEEAGRVLQEDRLVTPEKIELLQQIVDRQLKVLPDLYQLNEQEVSIYIGIPFCPTKCAYCTFPAYSMQGQRNLVDPFVHLLKEEIKLAGEFLHEAGKRVTTLYFGGGTPTSIEASQLDEIFQAIYVHLPMAGVREVTVEAGRPDTITPEKLDVLKKWRVDRISINPQSFNQETLKSIGRHHSVQETIDKYHLARSYGFSNINMDLIIGLPGETSKEVEESLKQAAILHPESLTVHTLSFKRASEMTHNKEKYPVACRDEIHKMMQRVTRWTKEEGYVPYYLYRQKNILGNLENVGYSLPGMESLYNIIIMEEKQTILGLGCGAVSKVIPPQSGKIIRIPNPKEPLYYVDHFQELMSKKFSKIKELYS